MAKELLICSTMFGLVVLVLFLAFSIDSLSYNQHFKSVENRTYVPGFHFVGLGHNFIPYEVTIATVEFSKNKDATLPLISCRTKDGLRLDLEINFQYRVLQDKIYYIYITFGYNMKTVLLRVTLDSISDVDTVYKAIDFSTIRKNISSQMKEILDKRLQKNLNVEVVFQLRSIDLPDPNEMSIQTQKLQSKSEKQSYKQMYIEVSQIQKNITKNDAEGTSQARNLMTQANTKTYVQIQSFQAEAYANLMKDLGLNKDELIQYLQIKDYPNGELVISLNDKQSSSGNSNGKLQ